MLNFSAVNPFTDSGSPWYYVVGVLFLILIFAALAVYIVVSGKRKKKREQNEKTDDRTELVSTEPKNDLNEQENSAEQPTAEDEVKESNELPTEEDRKVAEDSIAVEEPIVENSGGQEREQAKETVQTESQTENAEAPTEKPTEKVAKSPQKTTESKQKPKSAAPKQKSEAAAQTEKPAKQTEKQSKPKTQKPFIDRIIADKSVHGVYNAVKNVILSYPGIKAKITKEDEQFRFGEQLKAGISLESNGIVLKLAIDPNNVPSQFHVIKSDGELPVAMNVGETDIDSAGKLIMFAMNVALLTRNERHRYTDYVQNAVNAKNRAKKK